MQAESGIPREIAAGEHEFVAAMQWYGRRQRDPGVQRIERPPLQDASERGEGLLRWRQAKACDSLPLLRRQRIEQSRHRLVKTVVGDHGRKQHAQPGIPIPAGGGLQALKAG